MASQQAVLLKYVFKLQFSVVLKFKAMQCKTAKKDRDNIQTGYECNEWFMTKGSLYLHLNIKINDFLTQRIDAQMSLLENGQENGLLSLITIPPSITWVRVMK